MTRIASWRVRATGRNVPGGAAHAAAAQHFVVASHDWSRAYLLPGAAVATIATFAIVTTVASPVDALIAAAVIAAAATVGWAAWTWRRLTAAVLGAWATAALIVTLLGRERSILLGQQLAIAIGLCCLVVAGLLGAWRARRAAGNRAVTTLACDVVCLAASGVAAVAPVGAVTLATAGVLGILIVRGGGLLTVRAEWARRRSRIRATDERAHPDTSIAEAAEIFARDEHPGAARRGELLTANTLAGLDRKEWMVLHSRQVPRGPAVSHLVVGPAGVVVATTASWPGTVSRGMFAGKDGRTGEAYALNGSPAALVRRLEPTAAAARQLGWLLDMNPAAIHVLIVCGETTSLPDPTVEIELGGLWDKQRGCSYSAPVHLVPRPRVPGWLRGLPAMAAPPPRASARLWARLRHRSADDTAQTGLRRYIRDLAAVTDELCTPVG